MFISISFLLNFNFSFPLLFLNYDFIFICVILLFSANERVHKMTVSK